MGYVVAMPTKCHIRLSAEDRETLILSMAYSHSLWITARVLGQESSTGSREPARNATRDRLYCICTAQALATARFRRHLRQPRKLLDPWLWQYVRTHLGLLARTDCRTPPTRVSIRIGKHLSYETISVGRMCCHTEHSQARKVPPTQSAGNGTEGAIHHMTPVAERPADVVTCTVARQLGGQPH